MEPWTERSYHEDSFSAVLWPVASELSSFLPDACSHFSSLCLVAVAQAVWQWQRHTWQRQAPRSSMVPLHHAHSCPSQGPALWEQTHLSPCGSPSKARDKTEHKALTPRWARQWLHGWPGHTQPHPEHRSPGAELLLTCMGKGWGCSTQPGSSLPWSVAARRRRCTRQCTDGWTGARQGQEAPGPSREQSTLWCLLFGLGHSTKTCKYLGILKDS